MRVHPYTGGTKRTFQHALMNTLKSEYNFLGSQKVLEFIAEDIQRLVDEFYPAPERISSGWMIFTGTKATGQKAYPGQTAGDFQLVTIAWPVLTREDLQELTASPEVMPQRRDEWIIKRLIRIIEYGLSHPNGPVLLTLADLATILGLTTGKVSKLLRKARQNTGKPLTTKGQYFDLGMKPTHKQQIVELYEKGFDEADVARISAHDQRSVGRYIRDYERIKEALQNQLPLETLPRILNMLPTIVADYAKMVAEFHPNIKINVKDQKTSSNPKDVGKEG